MTPFREEGQKGGKSHLPAPDIFSDSFSVKYLTCQGAILGVACPEPSEVQDGTQESRFAVSEDLLPSDET